MRKLAGLTQKQLGKKAGVSQSLIARIEKGTVDPRLSTVRRIVEALHPQTETRSAKDVMHSPVATISAQDIVRRAVDIMKETGYSQLPVLIDGRVVGSVQEATLLDKVAKSSNPIAVLSGTVYNVMDNAFRTVQPNTPLPDVIEILSSHEPAVLVMKDGLPYGIVTKIDVISFGLSSGAGTA